MSAVTPSARPRGLEQWAGLGGIAYVVLFVGGVILGDAGVPDFDAAPAKVIDYYQDSGHRDKVFIAWILVVLGVFFFLWFLSALRQIVRRIDGDGFLTGLVTAGGAVYAALTLTAISVETAVKTMSDDTFHDQVYPGIIHAGRDAAYVIHSAGDIGLAALIIAASLAAARAALVPVWAGRVGVAVGILGLGSIAFFPQILVALWLLVAGWLVFRASTPIEPVAPPPGVSPARPG
jgi:hypothetical protein